MSMLQQPRQEYEMSEEDYKTLLDASKPVPYMVFGGIPPLSPQENANSAWRYLGQKMGFQYLTVKPIDKNQPRKFTAVPIAPAGTR